MKEPEHVGLVSHPCVDKWHLLSNKLFYVPILEGRYKHQHKDIGYNGPCTDLNKIFSPVQNVVQGKNTRNYPNS